MSKPAWKSWKQKPCPVYLGKWYQDRWAKASLSERALWVMASQEGVEETPSNWGPKVSLYLRAAGVFSPAPWCAAFLTWALLEAGADRKKLPVNPASTFFWWSWAKANKRLISEGSKIVRGNFGVWNGKGGGHIFAVVKPVGAYAAETLEGNTNKAGAREGEYVMRRERSWGQMSRYPRFGWIQIDDSLGVNDFA